MHGETVKNGNTALYSKTGWNFFTNTVYITFLQRHLAPRGGYVLLHHNYFGKFVYKEILT
jgi:hypothetical protein